MVDLYVRMVLAGQKEIDDIKPLWRDAVRIKVYVERICLGQITLDDVPEEWREAVREALEEAA